MTKAGAPPPALIRAFGEAYLRFATARPKSWAAIFERDAEGEPPDWYRARQTKLFAILERAILPLAGEPAAARRAARTLWAALHGLLALSLAGHLERVSSATPRLVDPEEVWDAGKDLETHAHELISVYLAGLTARSRP